MAFIAQITRSLFPNEAPRPARRPARGTSHLSQLFAVACALTPLTAMLHAMRETV